MYFLICYKELTGAVSVEILEPTGEPPRSDSSSGDPSGSTIESVPSPVAGRVRASQSSLVTNPSVVARSATAGWNTHAASRTIGTIEAATIEYPVCRFGNSGSVYTSG